MTHSWMMLIAAALLACRPAVTESGPEVPHEYAARIQRTSFGVPHAEALDEKGLGYGLGYAFAQDNFCTLAEQISTVNGERSLYFAALDAIARTRPDVLLLDIHMPGLDGLALAARYAELPPVVFITAHDEHAVRAFELGAVGYLLKVRPARLAQAIERARARGTARRATPSQRWPPRSIRPRRAW